MRLFYQSFGVSRGSRDGAYGQLLKRIVEQAAAPGTEISINGLGPNRALADQYRYLELIDTVEVMENGLRAEQEGYDAFLVANIFEPGLHELREVDDHAAAFRDALKKPEAGILVQEMVQDGVEVVLSCLRDTDFGPVLTIGLGGIGIELFRDVAHLALPIDETQVRAALQKLKLATLLAGFRGKPAADINALTAAAVRFGDLFLAMPDVAEFEINPLFVLPAGQGLRAVDALISLAPGK